MFPRLVQIGSFSLPTYGALVASAFLVALWLTARLAKEHIVWGRAERGVSSEKVVNLGVYCALTGMLGAKILMIVMDPEYRLHPEEIFTRETLQSAGIFYGGFIAALLFAYFYMKRQKMPVLATADLFAPGVAIGHGIGRLGCFAAGCCWGKPTSLPWAVTFTSKDATTGVPLGVPLHPTQLYEAFAEAIICLILIWRLKRGHAVGSVIGLYFLLYGMVRFSVEFLRIHDGSNPLGGPFVMEQWISLAVAVAGAWLVSRRDTVVAAPVAA